LQAAVAVRSSVARCSWGLPSEKHVGVSTAGAQRSSRRRALLEFNFADWKAPDCGWDNAGIGTGNIN
jgi:hypothetical protein